MRQLFFDDPNGVKIEINVMPAEGEGGVSMAH